MPGHVRGERPPGSSSPAGARHGPHSWRRRRPPPGSPARPGPPACKSTRQESRVRCAGAGRRRTRRPAPRRPRAGSPTYPGAASLEVAGPPVSSAGPQHDPAVCRSCWPRDTQGIQVRALHRKPDGGSVGSGRPATGAAVSSRSPISISGIFASRRIAAPDTGWPPASFRATYIRAFPVGTHKAFVQSSARAWPRRERGGACGNGGKAQDRRREDHDQCQPDPVVSG